MSYYEIVMNNNDLRGIILSYFRKKPEKICVTCKKVCVWNKKKIRKYFEIPIKDHSVILIQCALCNWEATMRDFYFF